jgi:hypothetical protein
MAAFRGPNHNTVPAVGLPLPAPKADAPLPPPASRLPLIGGPAADPALLTPDERLAAFGRLFAQAIARRRARLAAHEPTATEHNKNATQSQPTPPCAGGAAGGGRRGGAGR